MEERLNTEPKSLSHTHTQHGFYNNNHHNIKYDSLISMFSIPYFALYIA